MRNPTIAALRSPAIKALLRQAESFNSPTVGAIQQRISELEGAVADFGEHINEIGYEIAPVSTSVDDLLAEIAKLRQEIERLTIEQAVPRVAATKQAAGTRGMKLGTAERVREFHRLVKSGYSHRDAKKHSRCDPSTYYRWCLEATGEEPIQSYR